jgi:hypothetical protein
MHRISQGQKHFVPQTLALRFLRALLPAQTVVVVLLVVV